VSRKISKPSGHRGDTRPDQTYKTPKDLSVHESEDHGSEESVGWYSVYIMSEEGGDREGVGSETSSLLL
jgi:hypothetical protein